MGLAAPRPARHSVALSDAVVALLVVLSAALSAAVVTVTADDPRIPIVVALGVVGLTVAVLRPVWVAAGALLLVPADGLLPVHRLSTVAMFLAALGWLIRWASSPPMRLPRSSILTAFAGFVLITFIGIVVAPEPLVAARVAVTYGVMVVVAACIVTARPSEVELLLLAVAAVGGLGGAVAIVDPQPLTAPVFSGGDVSRATGGLGSPNVLGMLLAVTIPISIVFILSGVWWKRIFGLGCCGLALFGMALAVSRGAFIGLAGGVLILALWAPFRQLAILGLPLILVLSLVGNNPASPIAGKVVERITEARSTGGNNERLTLWKKVPEQVADRPLFGQGGLEYGYYAPSYHLNFPDGIPTHAHNLLFTIVVETGLIGLAAFLALIAALVTGLRRATRRRDPRTSAVAYGVAAALGAFFVNGILDYALAAAGIASIMFVLVGIAAALTRWADDEAAPHTAPGAP